MVTWAGRIKTVAVAAATTTLLMSPALVSCEETTSASEELQVVTAALCRWHFECGCNNATTIAFGTKADCEAGLTQAILDDVENKGQIDLDTGCAEELAAAFDTLGCAVAAELPSNTLLDAAAAGLSRCGIFRGQRAVGEACTVLNGKLGDDCEADAYCDTLAGVCTAVGDASEGKPCVADQECAPGLACIVVVDPEAPEVEEMLCAPLPGVGEPCSPMRSLCAVEAYCSISSLCVALPTPGTSCTARPSLNGLVCAPGSACNNGTCEAGIAEGQGCGLSCALGTACEGGFCRTAIASSCGFEI